ncbi:MAG: DUF4143 domain-containing protein [bacterium]|nr:DUF4143 domain-containing protein [bacterium]
MVKADSRAYVRRVVDEELDALLDGLPAICIEGPRAVGKTRTARRRARTVHDLDDPETLALALAEPSRLVRGAEPILIDEWQRYPPSWDLVRRAVDDDPRPGRFLLTGSTGPDVPPTHSGAGRIVTLRMRPMSLFERGLQEPTVSLRHLFTSDRPAVDGRTDVALDDYVAEIVGGGLPGWRAGDARTRQAALDGYLNRAVDHDVALMGYRARRPGVMRRWLTAYAAATATTATYETIRDAATGDEGDKPAKTTTMAYRDLLEAMWLVDPVHAWWPVGNPLGRLKQSPKHHLADPALACRLLELGADDLRAAHPGATVDLPRNQPLLGALFESLVTLDVRVHAQNAGAAVSHLRTWSDDREIDLIVSAGRRLLAIEVKLAAVPDRRDTRHLRWFRDQAAPDPVDAMIITTGRYAYRDPDGIAVVPAALLGP